VKRQVGFTLIELMVVVGLLSSLALTALPAYRTYQQRAYGSQAIAIGKRLYEAEIIHYLENDQFYPVDSSKTIFIPPGVSPTAVTQQVLQEIKDNLDISIPLSRHLFYQINTGDANADQWCQIRVWGPFSLFKTGRNDLNYSISKDGKITVF